MAIIVVHVMIAKAAAVAAIGEAALEWSMIRNIWRSGDIPGHRRTYQSTLYNHHLQSNMQFQRKHGEFWVLYLIQAMHVNP